MAAFSEEERFYILYIFCPYLKGFISFFRLLLISAYVLQFLSLQ